MQKKIMIQPENRCVCCGAIIPEGTMVCADCMNGKTPDQNKNRNSQN